MELDRRGCVVQPYLEVNQKWEEPCGSDKTGIRENSSKDNEGFFLYSLVDINPRKV
jgi:hypothetical protein